MAALMPPQERLIDDSDGTPESQWLPWLRDAVVTPAVATELVPAGSRAVVVAPHPDDEVLAVGGLLAQLAVAQREICIIAVTDGTASHPGSSQWPIDELARARPVESRRALYRLGVYEEPVRLHLPDGGLQPLRALLAERLESLLKPNDVVFTTWRMDGHPDHEATGHAAAFAAARCGARLIEVPVWAWHWAVPGDARLPWRRSVRISLAADLRRRKRHALQAFESQLEMDASTGAGPILRATTVARVARPFEVLFA